MAHPARIRFDTPAEAKAALIDLHRLRTQGDRLDRTYLQQWAPPLGVEDLLTRALGRG